MPGAPRKVLSRSGRALTPALMAKVRQQSLMASQRRLAARITEGPINEDDVPQYLHLSVADTTPIVQALLDAGLAQRTPATVAGQVVWQISSTRPDDTQDADHD